MLVFETGKLYVMVDSRSREIRASGNWHQQDIPVVLQTLGTGAVRGLNEAEAVRRLEQFGPNELIERGMKSAWHILGEQLTGVMVLILIVAAVISIFLGDYTDAVAILAIVVINAILGFVQEYRAERAMLALKQFAVPTVKVRREGHAREISTRELVPGDLVLLEAGNLIPADCRLIESANLQVQEAALTGESEPVEKNALARLQGEVALAERRNMVYKGTLATYGRAVAVVVETGMQTQLGRIAALIQTVEREPTPLQRRLEQLGRGLALAALGLVAIIFTLGLLRGEEVKLMLLTALSMAVAAVPEGLPAVVTITLALGAQRMLQRRALIRKLPAVETLGSVTVICSDKTGTLTENRMTVTVLDLMGHRIELTEELRREGGALSTSPFQAQEADNLTKSHASAVPQPALALLLAGSALCNDAQIEAAGLRQQAAVSPPLLPETCCPLPSIQAVGDPTESALVVAAARFGFWKAEIENAMPRVAEVPFDSERKRMTTLHPLSSRCPFLLHLTDQAVGRAALPPPRYIAFTKGAVEALLEISGSVWTNEQSEPLTETWRERISASHNELAQKGMRVLGIAFRVLESLPSDEAVREVENDLTFVGMIGMMDPPRPEVKQAVQTCQTAGIRPVMITGDHPLTARQIAHELGLAEDGRILSGQELDRLSAQELEAIVEEVPIYARVSPEHKLKIVQALQSRGHIVAMTGDGVNDAPALKKADIGVAMGITGTDVSKETADMVLLDDNFTTIVAAVEEGRMLYDNIRKFIKYLLTTNSSELWVMLLAPLLGMPLPLLPLQILWINLVTDGLPALALSVEPAERDTMRRPPYPPGENIFRRGLGRHILWVGLLMGFVSLFVGYWYWYHNDPTWQTMVFTTLTFAQMAHVLAIRSFRDSLFTIGLFSNKPLLAAVALTFILQLAVIYLPVLQGIFKTVALPPSHLAMGCLLSTVVFWAVELEKWFTRKKA